MVSIKVAQNDDEERVTGALLACFPVGVPTSDSLQNKGEGLKFSCFENSDGSRRRSLRAETDTLVFEGSVGWSEPTPDRTRYLIGVFDAEKDQLTLVDPGPTFEVSRQLKRRIRDSDMAREFLTQTGTTAEKKAQLVETFGSKKAQIARRKALGIKIADESSAGIDMINTTFSEQAAKVPEMPEKSELNILAPPCHLDATAPELVYIPEEIISPEEWRLLPIKAMLQAAKKKATEGYPNFILESLPIITAAPKAEREKFAAVASYTSMLIQLVGLRPKSANPAEFVSNKIGGSQEIAMRFLETFFESSSHEGRSAFSLAKHGKDKIILRLCALSLFIRNYSFNIDSLAMDLGLLKDELIGYFKELGCRINIVKNDGSEKFCQVTLKLPLSFPKPSKKRASKKK